MLNKLHFHNSEGRQQLLLVLLTAGSLELFAKVCTLSASHSCSFLCIYPLINKPLLFSRYIEKYIFIFYCQSFCISFFQPGMLSVSVCMDAPVRSSVLHACNKGAQWDKALSFSLKDWRHLVRCRSPHFRARMTTLLSHSQLNLITWQGIRFLQSPDKCQENFPSGLRRRMTVQQYRKDWG